MTTEERIASLETNQKNIFHQLSELKTAVSDIHELSSSVKLIAAETLNISKKVDKIDCRLSDVEKQPIAAYTHYKRLFIGAVITSILAAVIGAVMAVILK